MKKNIFKRIGLIACALAVAIISIFAGVQKNGHSAFASDNVDTVSTFTGSNIYLNLPRASTVTTQGVTYFTFSDFYDTAIISLSFSLTSDSFNFSINGNGFYYLDSNNSNWKGSAISLSSTENINTTSVLNPFSTLLFDSGLVVPLYFRNSVVSQLYAFSVFINSTDFNSNIYSIVFGSDEFTFQNSLRLCNFIRYYDSNDNFIEFRFPLNNNNYSSYTFQDRTYFLNTEIKDSQLYQNGYREGLADNQHNIYDKGFNSGLDVGYNNGFSDALNSSNDFTFTSLFSSVLEVPVKTFTGLFNFEILGVNLLDFFLGLLTFSLIIYVLRLLIGG